MKPREIDLLDNLDDLTQFNEALQSVVDMLAGCDDVNAPPASYLWRLLAILSQYSESVERNIRQSIK